MFLAVSENSRSTEVNKINVEQGRSTFKRGAQRGALSLSTRHNRQRIAFWYKIYMRKAKSDKFALHVNLRSTPRP